LKSLISVDFDFRSVKKLVKGKKLKIAGRLLFFLTIFSTMASLNDIFAKIEARLAKIDPADRKVLHVYKFVFTDDSGAVVKTWILDLKAVKLYEGTTDGEITLKMNQSTMISICTGALDSTAALNQDLIDVDGNLELLQLLKPFLGSL
jgi:SCP-2 sterol transfer family